jgi:hypothetical protein
MGVAPPLRALLAVVEEEEEEEGGEGTERIRSSDTKPCAGSMR